MRVVVTGGAGFLGSHVVDRLLADGHEVVALDNLITGRRENIAHLESNRHFWFVLHDVTRYIDVPGPVELRYANGPILSPALREDLPAYVTLAVFRTEISRYEPQKGTMTGTPAIVASEFGKGRVIVISPHPEATAGLESLVKQSVIWVGGKERS